MAEFTVSASLKLVEACLEKFLFRDDIDLICLAIKLLFSSLRQWRNDAVDAGDSETVDGENQTDERESLKKDCVRKFLKKLGSKLKGELAFLMPDDYQDVALSRELKVREITFVDCYFQSFCCLD